MYFTTAIPNNNNQYFLSNFNKLYFTAIYKWQRQTKKYQSNGELKFDYFIYLYLFRNPTDNTPYRAWLYRSDGTLRYVGQMIGRLKEGWGTAFCKDGHVIYEGDWHQGIVL